MKEDDEHTANQAITAAKCNPNAFHNVKLIFITYYHRALHILLGSLILDPGQYGKFIWSLLVSARKENNKGNTSMEDNPSV